MTLPSPLLLLSLATLLFLAFLLTTTALPSLLLFGDRQVLIGVIIDNFNQQKKKISGAQVFLGECQILDFPSVPWPRD